MEIDDKFNFVHYLKLKYYEIIMSFIYNNEFYSTVDGKELLTDRNIFTKERYKNIFEMRHIKLKYLLDYLKNKVKNYIFIRYEDLLYNFNNTLYKIKKAGLPIKKNILFPQNTLIYKTYQNIKFNINEKRHNINLKDILTNSNLNTLYEEKLGYLKNII